MVRAICVYYLSRYIYRTVYNNSNSRFDNNNKEFKEQVSANVPTRNLK